MEQKAAMEAFFANQTCVIVEPSKAFLVSIQSCLKGLGLQSTEIVLISKYEDARRAIEKIKPKVLITEYDVDDHNGLSLVELQQSFFDDPLSRISIVVSRNASDAVVAEAAEEEVDGFMIKPFSAEDFRKKLASVIQQKLNPSQYSQKIQQGRTFVQNKDYPGASQSFSDAKELQDKPSLACYYLGDVFRLQSDPRKALNEFREGRRYQPLHYKCLIGEFEVLVENREYRQAYELIPILVKNFPLTPARLTQVFIAAVFSGRFDYLPTYYEHFLKLEKRSPDLIKIASAALLTGGKWHLQKGELPQARDLFEKGLITVGRDMDFLNKIIDEFLKTGHADDALTFLGKAQPSVVGTAAYNRLSFKVDEKALPREKFLDKARKFGLSGDADPETYKILVKLFAQEDKIPFTEALITKGIEKYPELREALYQILEQNRPSAKS